MQSDCVRQLNGPSFQQDFPIGFKVVPGQRDLFVAGEVLDGDVNVFVVAGGDEVERDSVKVVSAHRQITDGALDDFVLSSDEVKLDHGSCGGGVTWSTHLSTVARGFVFAALGIGACG